jgi:hypothetical protein
MNIAQDVVDPVASERPKDESRHEPKANQYKGLVVSQRSANGKRDD